MGVAMKRPRFLKYLISLKIQHRSALYSASIWTRDIDICSSSHHISYIIDMRLCQGGNAESSAGVAQRLTAHRRREPLGRRWKVANLKLAVVGRLGVFSGSGL